LAYLLFFLAAATPRFYPKAPGILNCIFYPYKVRITPLGCQVLFSHHLFKFLFRGKKEEGRRKKKEGREKRATEMIDEGRRIRRKRRKEKRRKRRRKEEGRKEGRK